jgi:transcriptional regulator with XRE-family HTH domain
MIKAGNLKSRKIPIAFGAVLRELRLERRLSQERLAFESGVNRNYISLLELGRNMPSLEMMVALSCALQIPFGHFASLFAEKLKKIPNE